MKYKELLDELLNVELDNYSYFNVEYIECDDTVDDFEYYTVKISGGGHSKDVSFRLNGIIIEVELSEGSWYEICTYEYTVKYFWMALLRWG